MNTKKKTKKRKTTARGAKPVRDFDDVQTDIHDSCALVCVGYDLLLASSDGKNRQENRAFVVLSHGVHLLTKASGQLDAAASYVHRYCSQCGAELEQRGAS